MQSYRIISANMWTILTLVFCAVYPAQSVVLHQATGAIHIHKKPKSPLQEEYFPLLPDDVEATRKAEAFLKNLLPKLDTTIKKSVNHIILYEINALFALYLYGFVVKGFRQATLDNLVVRTVNSRVDFNASIPFITAESTVFMNGLIDDYTFATVGNLSTFLDHVKITGALDFKLLELPSHLFVLQIVDADIKIDISDMMIEFKIIEELEAFKMTLVQFMNKPVEDIVKSVSRAAVRLINEQLAKVSGYSILEYLVPPKAPLQGRSSYLRSPNYRYF